MELSAVKAELKTLVHSMLEEGILDSQFTQLQALQDESNPNFVAEVVTLFINDAQKIINHLNNCMSQEVIDFSEMDPYVHQIKGSSSSIGARNVKLACIDLQQASDAKNKEMCLQALNKISREYCRLEVKLHAIVQLQNTIFTMETNQRRQVGRYGAMSTQRR
ncbi:Histidine-containing phosphotransfer protein 1 [Morus notabilis]|uniref:Histidine-containing phosphotransfer protein n=2 Tax=Morus notabilis TaxID=981085 RepID=W9SDM6_9ROSA|nr:Histidine-containing phosphotransfer protein 1 [Morus notabilis]